MIFGGVTTIGEYLIVALLWGLPLALVAAIPLLALARRPSTTPARFVVQMLAALVGALAGYSHGKALYWEAHGSAPAVVYFLGGIVIGGAAGVLIAIVAWEAARRSKRIIGATWRGSGSTNADQP